MLQCDRRVSEVETVILEMAEIAEKCADNGMDRKTQERIDRKVTDLASEKALKMHDCTLALQTFQDQLAPVVERLNHFAANPEEAVPKNELTSLRLSIGEAKNAIANAANNGSIQIRKADGGTRELFVDRSFLDEAAKLLGEAESKLGKLRENAARFVSGNENATYDGADNELKTKVHILMGCMHQGVSACAMKGAGFAFNDTLDPLARLNGNEHPDGGKKTQSFALTRDDSGNIVIDHKVHFVGGVLMQITNGGDRFVQKKTDKNGGMDLGVKITIPRADLDRLGSADWTHYDPKQVNEALGDTNLPNRFSTAENLVPNQFRFTGSVDVTCEIRATSLHDLGEDL